MSERDFAAIAAKRMPPIVSDLSREELVEIVTVISGGDKINASFFNHMMERNFPHSWTSDLVFWPHRELTEEEVVDELLLRENLHLEGGDEAVKARQVDLAKAVMADPNSPAWARIGAESILGSRLG